MLITYNMSNPCLQCKTNNRLQNMLNLFAHDER